MKLCQKGFFWCNAAPNMCLMQISTHSACRHWKRKRSAYLCFWLTAMINIMSNKMPNISLIQHFWTTRLLDSSRDALLNIPFDNSLHWADTHTMCTSNVNTFRSSIIHSNYLWMDLLWYCHDSSTLMHKLNPLIHSVVAPSCIELSLLWIMSTVSFFYFNYFR
jgi:hypothetical protein